MNRIKISSKREFEEIKNHKDEHIVLTEDIDLENIEVEAIKRFKGVLDGQGNTIKNLELKDGERNNNENTFIDSNEGTIKNLNFQNLHIQSDRVTGGICNSNYGKIINCTVTGALKGKRPKGGIVNRNQSEIIECEYKGKIKSKNGKIGGIAADNKGTIKNCHTSGKIISHRTHTGGIASKNNGKIEYCSSKIEIIRKNKINSNKIGGITGINFGHISQCYFHGIINKNKAPRSEALIVGKNQKTVEKCYSISKLNEYPLICSKNGTSNKNKIKKILVK